jgi:hypothetical protein
MTVEDAYAEVERITRAPSPPAQSRGGNHVSSPSPLLSNARLGERGAHVATLPEESLRGNLPVPPFPFPMAHDPLRIGSPR